MLVKNAWVMGGGAGEREGDEDLRAIGASSDGAGSGEAGGSVGEEDTGDDNYGCCGGIDKCGEGD